VNIGSLAFWLPRSLHKMFM